MKIYTWCNRGREVREVIVDDPKDYQNVLDEVSKLSIIIEYSGNRSKSHVITSNCICTPKNNIMMNIEDLDILQVPLMIYKQGWAHYRLTNTVADPKGETGSETLFISEYLSQFINYQNMSMC